MKPLPAQKAAGGRISNEAIPSLPAVLAPTPGPYSTTNRRASTCPVQRAYPWMLFASTAIAALFCLMYITKPVIVAAPSASPESAAKAALTVTPKATPQTGLMPSDDRLPGERSTAAASLKSPARHRALPGPPSASAFEETNLRVQHILTAEAPGGHLDRIDLDVPVIYQSRSLRWTADETANARELLVRLMDYQEKSQMLRSEGADLLDAWNRLIGNSIPATDLRADSPSLPANQDDAADAPRPVGLITTESIHIQPAEK